MVFQMRAPTTAAPAGTAGGALEPLLQVKFLGLGELELLNHGLQRVDHMDVRDLVGRLVLDALEHAHRAAASQDRGG